MNKQIGFKDDQFIIEFEYKPEAATVEPLKDTGFKYDPDSKQWLMPHAEGVANSQFLMLALSDGYELNNEAKVALQNPPARASASTGLQCDYIDIESAITSEPPEIDFVLPGLIAGTVGSIIAPGATGKGYLALALGFSLAARLPLCGGVFERPKKAGCAVLFCGEDKAIELQRRIHAFGQWLHTQYPEDPGRVQQIIADCNAVDDAGRRQLSISSEHGHSVQLMDDLGHINNHVRESLLQAADGSRLIIIDTFRRFYGGDENSSGQVNDFLCALENIAEKSGSTILFTHHANKGAVLNGQTAEAGAARGSSVLTDNIRWQLNLATMTEAEAPTYDINPAYRKDFVQIVLPKANYVANSNGTTWVERKKGGVLEHVEWSENEPKPKSGKPKKGDLRTVQGGRK